MKRDKYCTQCGNQICDCSFFSDSDSSYCGRCGQELEDCNCKHKIVIEADEDIDEDTEFCDDCGRENDACICKKNTRARARDGEFKKILTGRSFWRKLSKGEE